MQPTYVAAAWAVAPTTASASSITFSITFSSISFPTSAASITATAISCHSPRATSSLPLLIYSETTMTFFACVTTTFKEISDNEY
jgi:hypothetical protein